MSASRSRLGRIVPVAAFAVLAMSLLFIGQAAASAYGIASGKQCAGPISVGDAYVCTASIDNTNSDSHGDVTTDLVVDVVFHPDGTVAATQTIPINSSTVFPLGPVRLIDDGNAPAPSCDASKCTIPFGDSVHVGLSHYSAQLQDVGVCVLATDTCLNDIADFRYRQVCNIIVPGFPCSTAATHTQPSAATDVLPVPTTTATDIHNAGHAVVTAVAAGTPVHDFVKVAAPPGQPGPPGTVDLHWFANANPASPCAPPETSHQIETLLPGVGVPGSPNISTVDATDFTQTPATAGTYAFQANYLGDGNTPSQYRTSQGACEPLNVVDAYIQITPQNASNAVGTNHTLTITVTATGGGILAAGTATASVVTPPSTTGAFVPAGANTCSYAGGAATATCTVVIASAAAGLTQVNASSSIGFANAFGSVTRATSTAGNVTHGCTVNCDDATKHWVDAFIQITPANASNAVGTNHTLTITVNATNGGLLAAGTATASIVTPPSTTGAFVPAGANTCSYAGGAATATCTVVITSAAIGLTQVHATSDISFTNAAGGPLTRATGTAGNVLHGCSLNCDDATKHWVDAYIQITPQNANNAVGTNHTLTITVNATGGGLLAAGTATASIVTPPSTTGAFVPAGANTCSYAGGTATATCTVVIGSAASGLTQVHATSDISFTNAAGGPLTRATSTAGNVTHGCTVNCDDATKHWVDAFIQITPQNANNAVGTNHTLTITVNATGGGLLAAGTATASIVTPPSTTGAFVPAGANTCSYAGGAATATCTVVISSAIGGLTQVHATSDISFTNAAGGPLTRATGTAGNVTHGCTINCDDATKHWVDAFIQITPQNANNAVGTNHTLTITVNATNGGLLAAGTATASIVTPPSTTGAFVPAGANTCSYAGGAATATCTVVISSAISGLTQVHATSDISFTNAAGGPLTRATGTAGNVTHGCTVNCDDATKHWVDAFIQITPANANNAVGTNHTLTITVNATNGGLLAAGTATASIVTPPSTTGAFVPAGANTCSYAGGAATATCTVVISSAAIGLTQVHATSDISFTNAAGGPLTRATGTAGNVLHGCSLNCDDATKHWVDAYIQITPQNANNAVGTNHTLTITVNATGGGLLAAGTATASIVTPPSTTGAFVPAGANTCSYAGGTATATCTVVIGSAASGLTQVHATSDISFTNAAGGPLTRATSTAGNVTHGCTINCDDATKHWVDAFIQITPQNANNAVGTNHTLTITVNATGGGLLAAGTATASIVTPPSTTGAFVPAGANTCSYAGGAATATCTVVISSAIGGLTQVHATSDISFTNAAGGPLTRATGTAGNVTHGCTINCDDATKHWVDAFIQITPQNANNAVGTNHTLTITVNATNGGLLAAGTATASIVTPPSTTGAFVPAGANTCSYAGGAATATCTVVISSAISGLTQVHATSDISFTNAAGGPLTRATGTAGNVTHGCTVNCDDATKHWVDAFIQITPANANNAVGTNHTLTITVNATNGGLLAAGTATASILTPPSTTGSFVGSPSCSYAGGGATATCTVVITSAAAGLTVVQATSSISFTGAAGSVTRTTGTAANTTAGCSTNCNNANKNWADLTIVTHVRDASGTDVTNSTTVAAGTVVHDEATVTRTAATPAAVPNPTGSVTFTLFNGTGCNGTVVSTDPNKPLNGSGLATSATFTTPAVGGPFSYLAHYNGDANYPAKNASCEPFTVQPQQQGQITETNVSCQDVLSGNSSNFLISGINYPGTTTIGQGINPGKFFFWSRITTTTQNQVVTVTQSNNSTNNEALFLIHQGWQRVYTGDCASFITGTQIQGGAGASFTIAKPGTYFIGIKYDPKSLVGNPVPVPATITYTFSTSLGGATKATVLLQKG